MKNRLNRRILREIKDEAGKNIVIFVFMAAMIGLVSGFLIADDGSFGGSDCGKYTWLHLF